jgi:hypothetical protein
MTPSQRPLVPSSRCRRWVFLGTLRSSPEGIPPGLATRRHGRGQAQTACPVVPGQGMHDANSDQDPVEPDTEGPDGVAAGLGRSAKRDQDSMMSLSPGVRPDGETEASDGAAAGLESVPADKARSARRDQDPIMSPWTGGAVCLPRTGPHTEPATGRLSRWGDGAAGRCGHRGGTRSLGGGGAVEFGRHPILSLPPGACPGGETMRLGVLLAGSGRFLGRERGPGTSEAAPAPCGQIAQQPCATVRAPMLVGGTPSCRRRPPGAFSTNRAATLCIRPGPVPVGGGCAVVPVEASGCVFDKSRSYPMQASGAGAGGWGCAVVPAEAPRCVFDKSRSYPMQASGDRCGWVGCAVVLAEAPRCVSRNRAATLCKRQETGAGAWGGCRMGSVSGQRGPSNSDRTPYNGRRCGRTRWLPGRGGCPVRGRNLQIPTRTLWNGTRRGRPARPPGWGRCLVTGRDPQTTTRTLWNRRRRGRTGRLPGRGCGSQNPDKTL